MNNSNSELNLMITIIATIINDVFLVFLKLTHIWKKKIQNLDKGYVLVNYSCTYHIWPVSTSCYHISTSCSAGSFSWPVWPRNPSCSEEVRVRSTMVIKNVEYILNFIFVFVKSLTFSWLALKPIQQPLNLDISWQVACGQTLF